MDSSSKVDDLRGFRALKENKYFKFYLEGLDRLISSQVGILIAEQDGNTNEHFRQVGITAALQLARSLVDKAIEGLELEVRQELEGQKANGLTTDPESIS